MRSQKNSEQRGLCRRSVSRAGMTFTDTRVRWCSFHHLSSLRFDSSYQKIYERKPSREHGVKERPWLRTREARYCWNGCGFCYCKTRRGSWSEF